MDWKRIEARFEEIDRATYGLAELMLFGGGGAILAIGLYCIGAAAVYGYFQLFTLATGAF